MNQQLEQFLINLGLNQKEAKVYLASLKLGPQTASVIANKFDMPRSSVNFVFAELVAKGFASKENKNNTTYYTVLAPEALEYILLEKSAFYKKLNEEYKSFLPILSSFQNKLSPMPRIRYFEGHEGLCRMLDDFCSKDETVLYISGHNMMDSKIRQYVYDVYLPISERHKNKNKIILNDGKKAREYQQMAKKVYDEFIFVNQEEYPFTLTTAIYGDKIAFWSYDPADMTGIIIENQLISDNMRTVFKVLREFFKKKR